MRSTDAMYAQHGCRVGAAIKTALLFDFEIFVVKKPHGQRGIFWLDIKRTPCKRSGQTLFFLHDEIPMARERPCLGGRIRTMTFSTDYRCNRDS